ncbi:hypothetical protein [Gimesia chilikensis]|uniref:hypothetical protein n=1 Tax=Gimesia chilikensis TaxID=2605989 RepID=UPI0011EE2795|nr:hypothetical protein [Gimesia chilikensis]
MSVPYQVADQCSQWMRSLSNEIHSESMREYFSGESDLEDRELPAVKRNVTEGRKSNVNA